MSRAYAYRLLACAAVAALASAAAAELIVHYEFEETSTYDLADSVPSPASDGRRQPPIRPKIESPGYIDNGLQFIDADLDADGDGGAVRMGAAATSEWKITGDFTATAWINLTSAPHTLDRIFDLTNGSNAIGVVKGWRLMLNPGGPGDPQKLELQANNGAGSTIKQDFPALRDVQIDDWTFVALRYDADGDASVTVLYDADAGVDAAAVAANTGSTPAVGSLTYGANAEPKLGARVDGNQNFLDGYVDEVRLYDAALTDAELADVYAIPEPTTALLLLLGTALLRRRRV